MLGDTLAGYEMTETQEWLSLLFTIGLCLGFVWLLFLSMRS